MSEEKFPQPTFSELMSPIQALRERIEPQAGPIGSRVLDLMRQAETDELTGLRNRRGLLNELNKRIISEDIINTALVYVDLDGFKAVNDALGHDSGDTILRKVGQFFYRAVNKLDKQQEFRLRIRDEAFRLGGDEFVILISTKPLDDSSNDIQANFNATSEKRNVTDNGIRVKTDDESLSGFEHRLNEGIIVESRKTDIEESGQVDEPIKVSGSFGFAQYKPGETALDFIKRADIEMYVKKIQKKVIQEINNIKPVDIPEKDSVEVEFRGQAYRVFNLSHNIENVPQIVTQTLGNDPKNLRVRIATDNGTMVHYQWLKNTYPNLTKRLILLENERLEKASSSGRLDSQSGIEYAQWLESHRTERQLIATYVYAALYQKFIDSNDDVSTIVQ